MAWIARTGDPWFVNRTLAAEADREARLVVCAIEGSSVDTNAVELAAQLAVLSEARLALLAVAPVPPAGAHEWGLPSWTLDEARRTLELRAEALDGRIDVECYLEAGNPVRRLVEFAARKRALLLVVGTRGPIASRPPSIVASGVARAAPCPVVVVPDGTAIPELRSHS
jgi:nucleotide-binding universal stress UspA family protein